jgi:DNA modification methylase
MKINTIYVEDCQTGLKKIPDKSVNCCVTSPPYYGLRDYGVDGQIGLEETPEQYAEKLVTIFREVRRVLRNDGTLWLNLGDTYYNYRGANDFSTKQTIAKHEGHAMHSPSGKRNSILPNLKGKDLIGIPWMVAFALRADGWYLRQDIIWHKPNPMPESVTDRCTKSHEYIFLLSKSRRYYYDAEEIKDKSITYENRPSGIVRNRIYDYNSKENLHPEAYRKKINEKNKSYHNPNNPKYDAIPNDRWKNQFNGREWGQEGKANKRSVWTVNTQPFKDAHFAVFPPKLIEPCIKAGCPEGGIVLDPFMGAGTTAVVARKLNRNFIGLELNKEYVEMANKRLYKELGMFL